MSAILELISKNLGYIVSIATALGVIYGWIAKPIKSIQKENAEQSARLKSLEEDTADLLCSQLTREHAFYMRQGWCSASDKQRVQSIYIRYKRKSRNHVS